MDGAELFSKCLAQATVVVKQVRPEHYANATPCADWHVGDLLDHLLYELGVVPKLLAGDTVEAAADGDENNENVVDEIDIAIELSANWQFAADAAEAVSNEADPDEIAHPTSGDVTNDSYLCQVAIDMLVHTWDLAAAIGMPVVFAPNTALAAYDHAISSANARQTDADDMSLSVDANEPTQIKLLAMYGRSANWHSAS